jgi:hypothetical protein
MKLIEEKRYIGRQIDWGAWGLKMNAVELLAFWRVHFAHCEDHESVANAIAALDCEKYYVLVIAERA